VSSRSRSGVSRRPTISVRGGAYAKVKAYCDEHGLQVSPFIDRLCSAFLEHSSTTKIDPEKVDPKQLRW